MIHLILGGCRSGKSAYAERLAESMRGPRRYLATCPRIPGDEEMAGRIIRHQANRAGKGWTTEETPIALAAALEHANPTGVVLVDCLTLWINNLLFEAEKTGRTIEETDITDACLSLDAACRARRGPTIFVSNEVGMGIVPLDPVARRYRDLVGRCNQVMAAAADEVIFMAAGLPLCLKSPKDVVTVSDSDSAAKKILGKT